MPGKFTWVTVLKENLTKQNVQTFIRPKAMEKLLNVDPTSIPKSRDVPTGTNTAWIAIGTQFLTQRWKACYKTSGTLIFLFYGWGWM